MKLEKREKVERVRRLGQRRQGGTLNGIRRTDGMNAFITEPPEFQLAGDETSILKKNCRYQYTRDDPSTLCEN